MSKLTKSALVLTLALLGLAWSASEASAQFSVRFTPKVRKISPTRCKVSYRVTASAPGLAKVTIQTSEFDVYKAKKPKPCPRRKKAGVSISGSCYWKGNEIVCTVTVRATALGKSLKATKVEKLKVEAS